MTQLYIDNTEVVLSANFSVTVKRENSIITKNGEYTYDCTLRLDNQVNRQLYGFLHRLNKIGNVATKRSAVLMADGKVYCRGTEVVTGWTDEEVKVQIVSGNSELNYFIGSSLMVEWLDMGTLSTADFDAQENLTYPDIGFTLVPVRDSVNGVDYNQWQPGETKPTLFGGSATAEGRTLRAQPYLCTLVNGIIEALGYTIGINDLENSVFRNVILINTVHTNEYSKMLPGWTVKEFMEEVEKFCNCCFIVDNIHRVCDIRMKASYYQGGEVATLRKVVDEYDAEVIDPEAEYSNSDLMYAFEDGTLQRLQNCEEMLGEVEIVECEDFNSVKTALASAAVTDMKMAKDTSTGRYYIRIENPVELSESDMQQYSGLASTVFIEEVNAFAPLRRTVEEGKEIGEVEMGIVPVPMVCGAMANGATYMEVAVIGNGTMIRGSGSGSFGGHSSFGGSSGGNSEPADDDDTTVENFLKTGKAQQDESKVQLLAAIYNGYHRERRGWIPSCYTDAGHAQLMGGLRYADNLPWSYPALVQDGWTDDYEGSLRLGDLDTSVYGSVYNIDTLKSVTFECYDNVFVDARMVVNIHNKLWVIREIEEIITAKGRKPRWKLVCHPITISGTHRQVEWVLEDGTWNDKNAWFDLGKWNDEHTQQE